LARAGVSGLPWFKCDPVAFNDGMIGLSPSERGAYATAILCIYARGAQVPEVEIQSRLGITAEEWRPIRRTLVARGKLRAHIIKGVTYLTNDRCEAEIATYQAFIESRGAAGRASAKARGFALRPKLRVVGNPEEDQ